MTTKYYSSTIPYYKRTTPVLLRTTKYYSSSKGLIERRQDCHFSAIDAYDSTIRVAPTTTKLQFYHSFARLTRTSLRKGCSVNSKISILLQFRAIDTHDFTKGLLRKQQISILRAIDTLILLQFRAVDTYYLTKGLHVRKHFLDHGGPPLIT